MLIPLGILAASGAAGGTFELISSQVLTGNPTTVSFSSIPSGYKHLQFRLAIRQTGANSLISAPIRLNSDGNPNYSWHRLYGTGGSVNSDAQPNQGNILVSGITSGNDTAGSFSAAIVDILDYSSTTKYKTIRALAGGTSSAGNQIYLNSGSWRNTAAVDTVSFDVQSTSFAVGSRFSLYGIKG